MNIDEVDIGDKVRFVRVNDRKTLGDGVFDVVSVNRPIQAVVLRGIGTVGVDCIEYVGAEPKKPRVKTAELTIEDKERIEEICGTLLADGDDDTQESAREILKIIWRYDIS